MISLVDTAAPESAAYETAVPVRTSLMVTITATRTARVDVNSLRRRE
ncbi:hypothetical protein [Streptomyces sp. NPDC000410]